MDFDVLVIGGGPGGYVAAIRAAQLGTRTALVEKNHLGGTCLNRGCIPTKTLLHASEMAAGLKHVERYGVKNISYQIDFKLMQRRKQEVVTQLRDGVSFLLRKNKVTVVQGSAGFLDRHKVMVQNGETEQTIEAQKTIIATGSSSVQINVPGAGSTLMNSDEALDLPKIPEKLVIVGGGAIGIEFATIFANLGAKVKVVELMPKILPGMDAEISALLEQTLKQRGINVYTGAKLIEIKEDVRGTRAVVQRQTGREEIAADRVLMAVGRAPNVEGLNLDKAGVDYDYKGIKVNAKMQTNQENICAIGDVTGGIMLAHLASAQGIAAVENSLLGQSYQNLAIVPACIYTQPEAASVGLTEEEAEKRGLAYKVSRFQLAASGKAVATGNTTGLIKMISGKKYGEVLGVHIIAPRATDLISTACLAMRLEATVAEIATTIHAHPSMAESIMEVAHIANGTPIHSS